MSLLYDAWFALRLFALAVAISIVASEACGIIQGTQAQQAGGRGEH